MLAAVAALAVAATAGADARTDYLIRILRTSSMFRVRTQAAISLGSVHTGPEVVEALSGALGDDHPAVRAAAAAALERHGDPSALPALRRAAHDREAAVRTAAERAVRQLERMARSRPRSRALPDSSSGTEPSGGGEARYYVAIGRPGTRLRNVSHDTLDQLRSFIERQVRGVPGVEVAPASERPAAANRVLRQRGLVGYYLDSSIVEVEPRPGGGLHVRVSVVVQTYPGRDIRSMLNGAATVTSGGGAAQRQVIEGALRSALRGLAPVMQVGAASARASAPRRRRR